MARFTLTQWACSRRMYRPSPSTCLTRASETQCRSNQGQFSVFSNTVGSVTSPACQRANGVVSNSLNTLYQNWACFMMGKNVTFTQSKLDLTVDMRQKS